jgi:translation initiation factor 2 alpha subunit (eIF-2alpha)
LVLSLLRRNHGGWHTHEPDGRKYCCSEEKRGKKNEKVLEKVEKKLKQSDLQVKNQISEIMQDTNKKFGELMKNIAYLTKVVEKGNSSLENKKGGPMLLEASADNRIHINMRMARIRSAH